MKKLLIAALVAGQILGAAAPAMAQGSGTSRDLETGAFGGVRLRIPFGGSRDERASASLAFAPTMRAEYSDGRARTHIGEGFEFGVNDRGTVRFSLAGTPVNRLVQGRGGPEGRRMGVSTLGWVAIGAGTVVVLVGGFYWWLMEESECDPGEC
ncbi:MAG TPA: hypothetical protein VEC11_10345 [Allosphingosinicella sp.]|nr:hypothetical protein [Allosphingosinicella sp.]